MKNVVDFDSLCLYREARRRLEENGIPFDHDKLLGNPQLCRDIISLLDYCSRYEADKKDK